MFALFSWVVRNIGRLEIVYKHAELDRTGTRTLHTWTSSLVFTLYAFRKLKTFLYFHQDCNRIISATIKCKLYALEIRHGGQDPGHCAKRLIQLEFAPQRLSETVLYSKSSGFTSMLKSSLLNHCQIQPEVPSRGWCEPEEEFELASLTLQKSLSRGSVSRMPYLASTL